MDSSKSTLAHDLQKKIWRSDDVNVSTYVEHGDQIEIKTSFPTNNSNEDILMKSVQNTTFALMKINEQIVDDLKRCGFVYPSPIQTTCIPLGRLGIDLIAQSKSGTGKTIVFVVSALEMILQDLSDIPCPKVLILAPTREIAIQIADIIDSLTINWKNFSCYKAIGGTKVSENISKMYTSQIIVGTPGRISSLLEMNFLKPHSIRLFVLDECDKLMEENFKKQIDNIYKYLPVNKQMIVTSATMSTEMTSYLKNYMKEPALIRLDADKPSLIGVMQYVLKVKGHSLEYLNFESKIDSLIEILKSVPFQQCFIFVNYQTRVKYLYDRLHVGELSTIYMSGDMTQKERQQTINLFRQQKYKIIVSTDLTSRGIDIESVNLVINIDVPIDCETYLHRIGRSGRFGSSGIAITIVGHDDEYKKFCSTISQYNLQIKELKLPLATNLWDVFYQEQSKNSRSNDMEWTKLKVDPFFDQLEIMFQEFRSKNDATSKKNEDNVNPFSEYLENLTPLDDDQFVEEINSYLSGLIQTKMNDEDKDKNDVLQEQNLIDSIQESSRMLQNPNHLSNAMKDDEEERENNLIEQQQFIESSSSTILSSETRSFSNEELFRKAFLNPLPISSSTLQESFSITNYNNLVIWRYLLRGGRYD